MKKILVTLALLLASLTASAQPATHALPNTVFGLTLGKPLTLPLCEKTDPPSLLQHPGPTCYFFYPQSSSAIPAILIALPANQKPVYATENIIAAELFQGRLQALSIFTPGDIPSQQPIINQVTQQFGAPQSASIVTAQDHQNGNDLHAEIGSHHATWHAQDMQISFTPFAKTGSKPLPTGVLTFSFEPADSLPINASLPLISPNTPPNTFYGFTLGKPLSLPLCGTADLLDLWQHPGPACYTVDKESDPATPAVHIVLPANQVPEYTDHHMVTAELSQNQLQALAVITSSNHPTQQTIIKQLTQQFGAPQFSRIVTTQDHQNGNYLKFPIDSHLALWLVGDVQIIYASAYKVAPTSIPTGSLVFTLEPAD